MKRLLIITLVVLAVAIAICTACKLYLDRVIDEMKTLSTELILAMEQDDRDTVKEKLVELATLWDDEQQLLETFCAHDDLHDVKIHIIEAEICIDYADAEDFFAAVSLISEALEHMGEAEQLTLTNLC